MLARVKAAKDASVARMGALVDNCSVGYAVAVAALLTEAVDEAIALKLVPAPEGAAAPPRKRASAKVLPIEDIPRQNYDFLVEPGRSLLHATLDSGITLRVDEGPSSGIEGSPTWAAALSGHIDLCIYLNEIGFASAKVDELGLRAVDVALLSACKCVCE